MIKVPLELRLGIQPFPYTGVFLDVTLHRGPIPIVNEMDLPK